MLPVVPLSENKATGDTCAKQLGSTPANTVASGNCGASCVPTLMNKITGWLPGPCDRLLYQVPPTLVGWLVSDGVWPPECWHPAGPVVIGDTKAARSSV